MRLLRSNGRAALLQVAANEENGVLIRSISAVHFEQSASFILEWNGLKLASSGDTLPNKWWIEHTQGADISIHECFLPATLMVRKQGFTPAEGLNVGRQAHTSPERPAPGAQDL